MLFNSFDFIIFFSVVVTGYYLLGQLPKGRIAQNVLLLAASYYFYGYWNVRLLGLICITTAVDFSVAQLIAQSASARRRSALLAASIVVNLGILCTFKYLQFFVHSAVEMLQAFGLSVAERDLGIILPVGVSFYTFQSMSYTIDVYRGKHHATRNLLDYALYVAFFPQLVAGPIERSSSLLPQVQQDRHFSSARTAEGLHLIMWGMYKKVFIADSLARLVEPLFDNLAPGFSGLDTVLATYAFAIQIYCDFSGYTDIARGVAKILGFELMLNFNLPYFAANPSEFWKRWHISLSTWLQEYLYFSLGGNRRGRFNTYRNLMLTMLLGGLWHGAAWNFVLWGAFHGTILSIWHWMRTRFTTLAQPTRAVRFVMVVIMFHLTCIGWLLFRERSFAGIVNLFTRIGTDWTVTAHTAELLHALAAYGWLLAVIQLWQYFSHNLQIIRSQHVFLRVTFYLFVIFGLLETFGRLGREFIYFQF